MRRSQARGVARRLLALLFLAAPAAAQLPPEGRCSPGAADARGAGDAEGVLREGATLGYRELLALAALFPAEVWRHRSDFFHEAMRMEIGPCHRRYPPPRAYAEAGARFRGRARLDAAGNLLDHTAGAPFAPDAIDPEAPDAGLRWAWNLERRHRGAGPRGRFRLVDLPGAVGGVQTTTGEWFQLVTAPRADLAATDYRVVEADGLAWIAGGRFLEPTGARNLAWRQRRPLEAAAQYALPDETRVYLPQLKRTRRAASTWVDGLYLPRYRVSGDGSSGSLPLGGRGVGPAGAVSPSGGGTIGVTEHLRRGFTGLALRPNAYQWRVRAVREVLAPLNVARTGYPTRPRRDWGPSELSLASDRWELRQAVVIQGALRERERDYDLLTLYVDTQTAQPLYAITKRRSGGRLLEVGILAHRWSGDQPGYPSWPDGEPAHVFDPVAAVFVDAAGGGGWRRESYDVRSTPPDAAERQRMLSRAALDHGH